MTVLRRLGVASLTLLLAACAASPPSEPAPAGPGASGPARALGLVEVTMTGLGTARMTSSAVTLPSGEVGPQAFADVPGGLQLRYDSNGFADREGIRYAWATFRVRNAATNGTPYPSEGRNLTFLAVSTPSSSSFPTIADTAMRNVRRFDGSEYADPLRTNLARSFIPTQKLETSGTLTPVENGADLQFLPESAVAPGQFTSNGSPVTYASLGVTSVMPFGFVVRNPSGTTPQARRTLPALAGDARSVNDQFDGLVTFAVRVPLQENPTDNPFSFSLVALAVSDSVTRVTQGVEERTADGNTAVSQRAVSVGASVISVLPGSTLPGGATTVQLLCNVRTAGTAESPTANVLSPSDLAIPGTYDRACFDSGVLWTE